jgi:uncharacterized protein YbjT (DUF2867 family)
MIFGKGSPVQQSLAKLAFLPVIPIFGKGTARVQPVFVADLARFLVQTLDDESSSLKTIEVGGPETVTMESLIQMIRKARKGSYGPTLHLPIGPIASCLRMAEPILRPVLPFTAGQLASFRHDGVAEPDPLVASKFSQMKSLKEMIDDAA